MSRIRLKICGIAAPEEARRAVLAGADAIGLEAGTNAAGMAPDGAIAEMAVALPPAVAAVILSRALTAGTIAQQVDAGAAGVVQLLRPLDPSEYPGLKRIIRGRKIIQCLPLEAAGEAKIYDGLADALLIEPNDDWTAAKAIADSVGIPVFLGGAFRPETIVPSLAAVRPFGIDLRVARTENGAIDWQALSPLIEAVKSAA